MWKRRKRLDTLGAGAAQSPNQAAMIRDGARGGEKRKRDG